ncbi:hypothetical protein F511_11505 [Dorcoceras hygrometricum]|uniref:Uncharacterized protein n=1 Tax=Dorcoceras hygrometricum TaxID=472368 RepID=A0A2Z7DBU7_9LAMI|nr:hypothetical protein F511_11505 [Dorcoceras hygrometricum]
MRLRFVVATGSPAASEFGRYCLLLVFRESLRLDDVSGATSFELVATLRFEVATGSSREKRCVVLSCDWTPSCWFRMRRRWSELVRRRFGEPAVSHFSDFWIDQLLVLASAGELFDSFRMCLSVVRTRPDNQQLHTFTYSSRNILNDDEGISGASDKEIQIRSYTQIGKDQQNRTIAWN